MSIQSIVYTISKTVAVNGSTSPITVYTPAAGKFVWVSGLFLQAEADVSITVMSASTAISGLIDFTGATAMEREWLSGAGPPVFRTLVASDAFKLVLSGTVQINGWAIVAEI